MPNLKIIPVKEFFDLFEWPIFCQLLGCISVTKKKAFTLSVTATYGSFGMAMASMGSTAAIKRIKAVS